MVETITHAFVSAKSDSPDTTLVSASEWNDGHVLNGGINGQVLVYDNTQPNNMRWVDNISTQSELDTIANPTASPANAKLNVDFTSNSPIIMTAYLTTYGVSTTGGVGWTASTFMDETLQAADGFLSGTSTITIRTINAPAGAHNVHVDLSTVGNVPFIAGLLHLQVVVSGV